MSSSQSISSSVALLLSAQQVFEGVHYAAAFCRPAFQRSASCRPHPSPCSCCCTLLLLLLLARCHGEPA
jgi:hypothetical protein